MTAHTRKRTHIHAHTQTQKPLSDKVHTQHTQHTKAIIHALHREKKRKIDELRAQLHDDDAVVESRSDKRLVQLNERVMQEQMQRLQRRVEVEMARQQEEQR